jgi:hypothetical protein
MDATKAFDGQSRTTLAMSSTEGFLQGSSLSNPPG